jgi:hypothetical protein
VVDDSELGHGPFVELQESDPQRVGTPPEAFPDPAAVDLFLINVVELSVEDFLRAVGGQAALAAGEVDDVEIVRADERHLLSIGAERCLFLFAGC